MVVGIYSRKTQKESAEDMAVGALDGNSNPLDMDMSGVGESPSDLDLPEADECVTGGRYFNPPSTRPAVDRCIICGQG